jgi:hypothetical protein
MLGNAMATPENLFRNLLPVYESNQYRVKKQIEIKHFSSSWPQKLEENAAVQSQNTFQLFQRTFIYTITRSPFM